MRTMLTSRTDIGSRATRIAALFVFTLVPTLLSAQAFVTNVTRTLPYGLNWADTDSTTIAKLTTHEELCVPDSLIIRGQSQLRLHGIKLSKFKAKDVILSYGHDGSLQSAEWYFTGTRMLTPVGVYDYLLPALKLELGDPNVLPDSSIAPEVIRANKSDWQLSQTLKEGEVALFSQWKIRRSKRDYIVDLRVTGEGYTVFSIVDETMRIATAAKAEADAKASETVEQEPIPEKEDQATNETGIKEVTTL